MSTFVAYSLGAVLSVLALAGGLLALWRLIPRQLPVERISDHEMRLSELETIFASFAAQFELEINRSKQKLARAKRALAQERGEDVEEETPPAAPAQPAPSPLDLKAELRRRAFGGNP